MAAGTSKAAAARRNENSLLIKAEMASWSRDPLLSGHVNPEPSHPVVARDITLFQRDIAYTKTS